MHIHIDLDLGGLKLGKALVGIENQNFMSSKSYF